MTELCNIPHGWSIPVPHVHEDHPQVCPRCARPLFRAELDDECSWSLPSDGTMPVVSYSYIQHGVEECGQLASNWVSRYGGLFHLATGSQITAVDGRYFWELDCWVVEHRGASQHGGEILSTGTKEECKEKVRELAERLGAWSL